MRATVATVATGFAMLLAGRARAGIGRVVLKSGDAGKAKMILRGKGAGLTMPILPPALPPRARMASTSGTCWEAEFRVEGVVQSSSTLWTGRAHPDGP